MVVEKLSLKSFLEHKEIAGERIAEKTGGRSIEQLGERASERALKAGG